MLKEQSSKSNDLLRLTSLEFFLPNLPSDQRQVHKVWNACYKIYSLDNLAEGTCFPLLVIDKTFSKITNNWQKHG